MANKLNKDEFEDAKAWNFPPVEDSESDFTPGTDALNRPRGQWKYEAPEEEQEVKPLTAEDIEAIRASAFQEGLTNGHAEGFEKGREEGFADGLEAGTAQGKEDGLAAGMLEAKSLVDEQNQTLQSLFDQIHQPLAQINSEVKKELVVLALSLAKAVIKVEVSLDQNALHQAIEEGIAALPIQENAYQIELNPDDLALVQQKYNAEQMAERKWVLKENTLLERGGCKILTSNNAVDLSIAKRCEDIFTPLLFNQGLTNDPRAS